MQISIVRTMDEIDVHVEHLGYFEYLGYLGYPLYHHFHMDSTKMEEPIVVVVVGKTMVLEGQQTESVAVVVESETWAVVVEWTVEEPHPFHPSHHSKGIESGLRVAQWVWAFRKSHFGQS